MALYRRRNIECFSNVLERSFIRGCSYERSKFTIRSTLKFHTDLASHTLSRVINNDVCVRQVSHLKQPYLSRYAYILYLAI